MARAFFDLLADALGGFLPPAMRDASIRVGSRTIQVRRGEPAAVHFEAQVIGPAALRAGKVRIPAPALEIGLHAEHPAARDNDAVLERLARTRGWQRALPDAEAGPFVGRQVAWRRVSELWGAATLSDEEAIEAAERLATYVRVLSPLL